MVLFIALLLASACSILQEFDYDPVEFTVVGETAVMNGVIDGEIEDTLKDLLNENPQITTIVMQNVDGSVDDEANLIAAHYVRNQGLNTHIPSSGLVASGGTDFFLAGVKRTAGSNVKIGVHSWSGGSIEAAELPENHIEHKKYLDYYRSMEIPSEFYWFTLKAAPSHDIHWMNQSEIKLYKIVTQ